MAAVPAEEPAVKVAWSTELVPPEPAPVTSACKAPVAGLTQTLVGVVPSTVETPWMVGTKLESREAVAIQKEPGSHGEVELQGSYIEWIISRLMHACTQFLQASGF